MPEATRRRDGRWLRRSTTLLVVIVLAAAAATYHFGIGQQWFARPLPDPVTQPALVPPPPGLALPAVRKAGAVAAPTAERPVKRRALARALNKLVHERKLGRHVVVRVAQLSNGRVVYSHGSGSVTPASTMKLLTTVAALQELGPEHRFETRVVARPRSARIVLVGGGDPLLGRSPAPSGTYPHRADLSSLAARTAGALRHSGRHTVRLEYDARLFRGPRADPRWEPDYLPDNVVSPISALWVDEGRERTGFAQRVANPPKAAAEVFSQALRAHGITVLGEPQSGAAPSRRHGGRTLASVRSAPLAEIVQHIVEVSDNEGAEVLAHQVGVATGHGGSFAGGVTGVRGVLRRLGIDTGRDRIYDGSGLSRDDRLRPETLLAVLRTAVDRRHQGLRAAVVDLPVAGFTGSLAHRFRTGDAAGLGMVRAKTGTLTGVHGLAGTVTSRDGAVMAFVAVADHFKPIHDLDVQTTLDEIAAALAGCGCNTGAR